MTHQVQHKSYPVLKVPQRMKKVFIHLDWKDRYMVKSTEQIHELSCMMCLLIKVVQRACDELVEEYEGMLREQFSYLMEASVRALERKLKRRKEKDSFIEDLRRQYCVNSTTIGIKELLDAIRMKRNWGLTRYRGLHYILRKYVDEETFTLREKYSNLVIGFYEVREFFCRYKELVKIKYAHSLQARYKVPPATIEEIKKLWNEICKRFILPPLKALLYDKRYSSLTLTWLIDADEETTTIIRNLLTQHLQANTPFLQDNNITHLIYNFEVLYPVSIIFLSHCYILHSIIPTDKNGYR